MVWWHAREMHGSRSYRTTLRKPSQSAVEGVTAVCVNPSASACASRGRSSSVVVVVAVDVV